MSTNKATNDLRSVCYLLHLFNTIQYSKAFKIVITIPRVWINDDQNYIQHYQIISRWARTAAMTLTCIISLSVITSKWLLDISFFLLFVWTQIIDVWCGITVTIIFFFNGRITFSSKLQVYSRTITNSHCLEFIRVEWNRKCRRDESSKNNPGDLQIYTSDL